MVASCYRNITFLIIFLSILLMIMPDSSAMDKAYLRWLRNKPVIDSIVIEGNDYFTDSHIKQRMYSKENSVWRVIKGDRRRKIQRETPARDSLEIKFIYLSNGFLDVSVVELFEMLPDSSALIRVGVNEGRQYFYGNKIITGLYPDKFYHELEKTAKELKEGKPINFFDIQMVEIQMKTIFANDGYPHASIKHEVVASENKNSDVKFNINSDSLVYFGNVELEGIKYYPAYTAYRELRIDSGSVYRRQKIIDSQRRLFESGYFTTLQLNQRKISENRLRPDFTLRVSSRKPQYFTFQTGAGQSEYKDLIWDISSSIGTRNLFGSRKFSIGANYSISLGDEIRLVTNKYQARYTEPWFLGIRMPLTVIGELQPKIKDPVQDYKINSWSFSISTQKRFGTKTKTGLGLEYESIEISGVSPELAQIIKEANRISVRRKMYFTYLRDSRNNLFLPTRGSVTEFIGEYIGGFLGGDASFTHTEASWSRYQVVWPGWVAAARLKVGAVEAFGDSYEVPINDRLYLGGANSIRAFRENSLGPAGSDGTPLGAGFTVVYNQEFRWKTLQIFKFILRNFPLWQSVFVDIGNGFSDHRYFKLSNMAISYGTGLQLVSPAGPIRVDYARRVPMDNFGFADRWHFTILYAF